LNDLRHKTRKEGEDMDYVVLVVSLLVALAVNFAFMIGAAIIALKSYTKLLAQIIDTCASESKDELFVKHWRSNHR
jgi:hypothetical protein